MHPEIHGLPLHPVLLAAAVGAGVALAPYGVRRAGGIDLGSRHVVGFCIAVSLCGLLGAKLDDRFRATHSVRGRIRIRMWHGDRYALPIRVE